MFDQPIEVLDSYLRFTDLVKASRAIDAIGRTSVEPVIARRGQLVANLWRCGWDLEAAESGGERLLLQYTRAPLASWEISLEAIRAIAPFVVNGSFLLLRGDQQSVQQVRFLNGKADFERGRLAFVPQDHDSRFGGHVVIGIDDSRLAPIHAGWLSRELVPPLLDMRIEQFEVRAELRTPTGRHVGSSGPRPAAAE